MVAGATSSLGTGNPKRVKQCSCTGLPRSICICRPLRQYPCFGQLEQELKNFDADLMGKPRWLVFTKADLLPADEAGRKAEEAVETLGWEGPWMLISSVTKSGTEELMQKVSAELELLEDEESVVADEWEPLPEEEYKE